MSSHGCYIKQVDRTVSFLKWCHKFQILLKMTIWQDLVKALATDQILGFGADMSR